MTKIGRFLRGVSPWIVLWLSAPLGGLIAFVALGPTREIGPAFAGGALIGLAIGAAQGWALRRPLAGWMVASALGLAIGNGLSAALLGLLPGSAGATLLAAAVAGTALGSAQVLVGAPLRWFAWIPLLAAGWTMAWGVSLALAIDAEQGFGIFGSTGSLLFAITLALVVRAGAGTRIASDSRAARDPRVA